MTLNQLQSGVMSTAEYPNRGSNLNYTLVGFGGEAGETLNTYKKFLRRDPTTVKLKSSSHPNCADELSFAHRDKIRKELRGALWYLVASFVELGTTVDEQAQILLAELKDRSNRGVIKGTGDDR